MITFFIADISGHGGTERVTSEVASMLAEQTSFPIEILSLQQTSAKPFFPVSPKIKLRSLFRKAGHGITRFPITWHKLHRYVKMNNASILVDVDGILDLYSIPATIGTSVRVISWEHFNYFANPTVPYRKISRKLAGRFASAIVTITEQDRKNYQDNLKVLRCPVITITNPMPPFQTHPYEINSKTIISAGRLTNQKGFDLLLQAAKKVLPQHPQWQWYILGEGEQRTELEETIHKYGLSSQIHMPGMVNIDDYLQHASFFVLASRYEGLGMVLLEAKAHKLPLISFDCPVGPNEIIENGTNGILVPPENTELLAKAVNELIDSKQLREFFSNESARGTERFQAKFILKQWVQLLNKLGAK